MTTRRYIADNNSVSVQTLNATNVGGGYYDHSTVNNITHHYAAISSRVGTGTGTKEEILAWLNAPSFHDIYQSALEQRIGNTGAWFLQTREFRHWAMEKGRILWITGIPGSGKTVLGAIVVRHLKTRYQDCEDVGVTFAFLRYTEAQSGYAILTSLLGQLIEARSGALMRMQPVYRRISSMGGTRPTLRDIHTALSDLVASFSRVYVIVDGFDEACDGVKNELLQWLPSLGINLLVLSRPLALFRLDAAVNVSLKAHAEDIETYITERIRLDKRLAKMLEMRPDVEPTLRNAIQSKSDGMFLVAKLQMDEIISSSNNIHGLFRALERLPSGIQEMYRLTLGRIERQTPDDIRVAHRVLHLLLQVAKEDHVGSGLSQKCRFRFPPSTSDIQFAITANHNQRMLDYDTLTDVSLILSACCGLVVEADVSESIGKPGYKTLRFIHYTAPGYIEKARITGWDHPPRLLLLLDWAAHLSDMQDKGLTALGTELDFLKQAPACLFEELDTYLTVEDAFLARKWDALKSLVEHFGGIDNVLSGGKTALEAATQAHDWEAAQVLVSLGAKISYGLRVVGQAQDWEGLQVLIGLGQRFNSSSKVVTHGWVGVSTLLGLGSKTDISATWRDAVSHKNWWHVAILVELGVDVNIMLKDGQKALEIAILAECWDLVYVLVDAGADVNFSFKADNKSALYTTCKRMGPEPVLALLLKRGADVNSAGGNEKRTCLHAECRNGRDSVVQLLLDHGADLTLQDIFGRTPLHSACNNGWSKCTEILLKHAKNPVGLANTKNNGGETPLHDAYRKGCQDSIKLLLKSGSDPTIKNNWGKVPHQQAPVGFKLKM